MHHFHEIALTFPASPTSKDFFSKFHHLKLVQSLNFRLFDILRMSFSLTLPLTKLKIKYFFNNFQLFVCLFANIIFFLVSPLASPLASLLASPLTSLSH